MNSSKLILSNNFYLDSLHDCEAYSIELFDKELKFLFKRGGLGDFFQEKGVFQLKVTFRFSKDFIDERYCPIVRQINQCGIFFKTRVKYFTLKKFIKYLNRKHYGLRFYAEYFSKNECMLITELIKNGRWQMGNEFELSLLVDEVIYEWSEDMI